MLKALFLSFLLLAGISSDSYAHPPAHKPPKLAVPAPAVQDRVRDAVVDLEFLGKDGWWTFCTGVAVGPHTVATNAHCIVAARKHNVVTHFNRLACSSDEVVAFDGRDNVLIHTCQRYKTWVKMANRSPYPRERVFEYGHPNGLPLLYREGYLAGVMVVGDDTPVVGGEVPNGLVWVFDINTGHGDSGGPILSMDGTLLCTVSFGFQRDGDAWDATACYPPWFTKQQLALIS